jgi:hypothetical protein
MAARTCGMRSSSGRDQAGASTSMAGAGWRLFSSANSGSIITMSPTQDGPTTSTASDG